MWRAALRCGVILIAAAFIFVLVDQRSRTVYCKHQQTGKSEARTSLMQSLYHRITPNRGIVYIYIYHAVFQLLRLKRGPPSYYSTLSHISLYSPIASVQLHPNYIFRQMSISRVIAASQMLYITGARKHVSGTGVSTLLHEAF